MENPEKTYRPPPIPCKYQYAIKTLSHYGFGKPSAFVEHALNSHAIANIEEILRSPEKFEAQDDIEYLELVIKWLRQRETQLNKMEKKKQ